MNSVELLHMMDDADWVQMKFDPELLVNVYELIYVMANDPTKRKLTDDQWEEAKERCVDVMEQFLELRHEAAALEREVADLERNLKFYVRNHNDLEVHFLQTHGRQAYREFRAEMDKRHAEDARKIKLASKPAWKSHMWVKGEK
jgi:hypothetical protein